MASAMHAETSVNFNIGCGLAPKTEVEHVCITFFEKFLAKITRSQIYLSTFHGVC